MNGSTCSSHAFSSSCSAETVGAVGSQQFREYGELLLGQRYVATVPEHLVPGRIERDAGPAQHRRVGRATAPAQREHARGQLGEGERLGQVVVRAQTEARRPGR